MLHKEDWMEKLLDRLTDEFEVIALRAAMSDLGRAIDRVESHLYESDLGAPSQRHVQQEFEIETIDALLGAAFVIGQSHINRTVTAFEALRAMGARLPNGRDNLLAFESCQVDGHDVIVGIDAIANYFKHSPEWPRDWQGLRRIAANTAAVAQGLGLRPADPDNIMRGAGRLGLGCHEAPTRIVDSITVWRQRVAARILRDIGAAPTAYA
jgi:hypothetical protein